ncbi:MAG: tRNA (adenosine(37)-N6)-threonylcarbamoyltransferase complex ATPase subunit type 1 TsaE [Gammaproteobacteria bacterium]|nr:MAG: tRNA (adenosine(37)-N6)-threonylcarbamoyltransferase complex ATPase subunit type 1 TsaE [Gammaproteobacteria bacterium]
MTSETYNISALSDLRCFAVKLAQQLHGTTWVYLNGDLGCGKTTFAQQFIAAKGYTGRVTSPTYAIMQDYNTPTGVVIHCDLYRLSDAEELYEIGLIELAEASCAVVLIEWASKGRGILPPADWQLDFTLKGNTRNISVSQGIV